MVSVRKSHQMSLQNFEQWLEQLALIPAKNQALVNVWQQVQATYSEELTLQGIALEMVEILSSLNMDKDVLTAALIWPLFDKQHLTKDEVTETFGKEIALLVRGVSQMAAIRTLQSSNNAVGEGGIDNIRRMLLSMVKDVRAVVIKLAERVCYLRLIKNSDEEERVLTAKETEKIFAPLANRLGIGQLKWELEDISFRYLHPDTYKKIAKLLDETRLERERYMVDFVGAIENQLNEMRIEAEVAGRPKHIFSIWKKMHKKSLGFEQLFDVRAVRIIVDKLQDCYSALGVVHTLWRHLPNEFSDYVATPKPNGYQSIHTVVVGPEGKTVEVQIRTRQMHEDAELGVAAHWRYKEGSMTGKDGSFDEKINWLRKILQWQEDVSESGELLDELRSQVFEDRIYVFTPNGDVIDLPLGATPLDFAYYIHSNVGHTCVGAKVAGRIVPFTYKLNTGEQVEILTNKGHSPSRDWLNPSLGYLHTSRARSKVQSFFKALDKDKNLIAGKELFENELSKLGVSAPNLKPALSKFNVHSVDDLYSAIGAGDVRLFQVINFVQNKDKKPPEVDPKLVIRKESDKSAQKVDDNGITVSGVGNLMTHLAKCCLPVPGDAVLGFITQGRGIAVHRADCEQLKHALEQSPEREIEVQWGEQSKTRYPVAIEIIAEDRQGLLRDITTVIANDKISVVGMESKTESKNNSVKMWFKLEVDSLELLSRIVTKIDQLDDVVSVKRVKG